MGQVVTDLILQVRTSQHDSISLMITYSVVLQLQVVAATMFLHVYTPPKIPTDQAATPFTTSSSLFLDLIHFL